MKIINAIVGEKKRKAEKNSRIRVIESRIVKENSQIVILKREKLTDIERKVKIARK